jgi:hypothetical protein
MTQRKETMTRWLESYATRAGSTHYRIQSTRDELLLQLDSLDSLDSTHYVDSTTLERLPSAMLTLMFSLNSHSECKQQRVSIAFRHIIPAPYNVHNI